VVTISDQISEPKMWFLLMTKLLTKIYFYYLMTKIMTTFLVTKNRLLGVVDHW